MRSAELFSLRPGEEAHITFKKNEDVSIWTAAVEVASTPEAQAKGLSERTHLDDGEGMLFVFPRRNVVPFTMADTEVDLDIIFMNRVVSTDGNLVGFEVVNIESRMAHDREFAAPTEDIDTVLEIPYGSAFAMMLARGDVIKFEHIHYVSPE